MKHKKRHAKATSATPAPQPLSNPSASIESKTEQSGDLQGLSDVPDSESESVRELAEEGQFFEAAVTSGVEDAPDADAGPIKLHRRKMDDVPPEYTDHPPDEPTE